MSDQRKGGIAWTEETWNPLRGCSRVSEGCRNCYAETVAGRFSGPGQPYEGLVRLSAEGKHGRARWNGVVRLVPEKIDQPIGWRRPRRIFVNSMSDLFHETVPFEQIDTIFGVMAACRYIGRDARPGHVFQILTKRPERMREYLSTDRRTQWASAAAHHGGGRDPDGIYDQTALGPVALPNVWLGVSVEDQASANARIPLLLETPAAVRWVSYEPAIGPVDLERWIDPVGVSCLDVCPDVRFVKPSDIDTHMRGRGRLRELIPRCPDCGEFATWTKYDPGLDWIVVGGESGPGARPFDLAWARSVIEQAKGTGCRVFVKQLGAKPIADHANVRGLRFGQLDPRDHGHGDDHVRVRLAHGKGADPSEWPTDLNVREWPEVNHGEE